MELESVIKGAVGGKGQIKKGINKSIKFSISGSAGVLLVSQRHVFSMLLFRVPHNLFFASLLLLLTHRLRANAT